MELQIIQSKIYQIRGARVMIDRDLAELAEIRAKLQLLERNAEDMLGDINDLSEDMRKDIDNIYVAIGELSSKSAPQPRRKVGFGQPWRDE